MLCGVSVPSAGGAYNSSFLRCANRSVISSTKWLVLSGTESLIDNAELRHDIAIQASLTDKQAIGRKPIPLKAPEATEVVGTRSYPFRLSTFLLGLVAAQSFSVGGQFYIGELFCLVLLLGLLSQGRVTRLDRRILFFAGLWSVAQFISDIYNSTPMTDAIKGELTPLFFAGTITGLAAYFRTDLKRLPSFILGAALGQLVGLLLFPSEFFPGNPWKWGLGQAVITIVIAGLSFFAQRKGSVLVFVVTGVLFIVSAYFGARSLGAIPLVGSVVYAFFQTKAGKATAGFLNGGLRAVRVLALLLPLLLMLSVGASALFSSEFLLSKLPEDVATKYESQASGAYNIVLAGRTEILISSKAFLDSPLLGHGSWARDETGEYRREYERLRYELGYTSSYRETSAGRLIPAHSFLMSTLVYSGVVGGLFWVFFLIATGRRFVALIGGLPVYFFVGMTGFLWDLFFSPFGAGARWPTAVFFAGLLAYVARCPRSVQGNNETCYLRGETRAPAN
jgi:hypothetical protein